MKQGLRNYICQGSLETVSCPNQLSLNITFANWGRAGKNKCSISATNANFGQPCKATYKYLGII